MESSLEKKQRVNLLMDFYGDLLTEKHGLLKLCLEQSMK